MAQTAVSPAAREWSAADLLEHFGPIPLWRIRTIPSPGAATEDDVLEIHHREDRLCELVDGVLVEKTVGTQESYLAVLLSRLISEFVESHDLGFVLGSDGMARLNPGLIRIPDVSFVSWRHFSQRRVPATPMLDLAPDLAVEVLSPSNTTKEMERKLRDYFEAGVSLVWYIDPPSRTVRVYRAPEEVRVLDESGTLDGFEILPGFSLSVARLFERLD